MKRGTGYPGTESTYGMMEAGQPLMTSGSRSAFVGGVKNDSPFRTNVGVASGCGRNVNVLVEAYDTNGEFKGEWIMRLKPWSTIRIGVDSFASSFADGYLILIGLDSADDARWIVYATTTDNISGDSTFAAAKTDTQYTWVHSVLNQSGWW